jgi:uncharacterized membrane protein YqjE
MSRIPLMNTPPEPATLISALADINPLDAIRKLRSAGSALSAQLALHGQLFKVEWAEEKIRLSKMLGAALLGLIFFLCANIAIGVLLATLGWQAGYLLPVVIALIVVYAAGTWLAWRKWQALSALSVHAFATLHAELAADVAVIRSKL